MEIMDSLLNKRNRRIIVCTVGEKNSFPKSTSQSVICLTLIAFDINRE